jgi:hypothetical protein
MQGCGAADATDQRPTRRTVPIGAIRWVSQDLVAVGPLSALEEGRLFAADDGATQVVALDVVSGRVLWRSGRPGGGPGEFGRISSIIARGDYVYVVEASRRSVTLLAARDGAYRASISTQRVTGMPRYVCAPNADTLLLLRHPADTVRWMSHLGTSLSAQRNFIAVDDPRGILTEQVVSSGAGDACVVAGVRNATFALVRLGERSTIHQLPGEYQAPRWITSGAGDSLSHSLIATVDVEVADGRVWFLRSGSGDERARLVDVYDLASVSYLGTLELPARTSQFAVASGVLMARVRDSLDVSRIVAYDIPPEFTK